MPLNKNIKKVLVIGSGPIVIGQAAEFDYAGAQACRVLKDAGLEHLRFHDLRHTFATLALQNGIDVKTVSSMLGHFDAGFTLRTYTHVTRQMQESAAEKMGNFMAQVM